MTATHRIVCVKIIRSDGQVYGLTNLDVDITVAGQLYLTQIGFTESNLDANDSLSVNNAEVESLYYDLTILLAPHRISRVTLAAGYFDDAKVDWFLVDFQTKTVIRQLASGYLGEVTLFDDRYVAEFRSLASRLNANLLQYYSPICRTVLGTAQCGVDLAALRVTGSVTGAINRLKFQDSTRAEADNHFRYGQVTFTSGDNNGFSMEVESNVGPLITLWQPLPFDLFTGDTYSMEPGCDLTFETCRDRFSNVINFRGEPHSPGEERLLQRGS